MPTLVVTTGGVALMMAFLAFGRRRRDGAPTASDAVLAAAAASGMPGVAGADLVPPADGLAAASRVREAAVPVVVGPADANIPRWRRQSLLEARKADPARVAHASVSLTFSAQASAAVSGLERRRIRYRLVSLLDQPDDVRGVEIGSLDEGDEVVLLERLGTYWRVLCPDGREGWLHKMVLGAPVVDGDGPGSAQGVIPAGDGPVAADGGEAGGAPKWSWTSGDEGPAPGAFEDVLRLYSERRQRPGDA